MTGFFPFMEVWVDFLGPHALKFHRDGGGAFSFTAPDPQWTFQFGNSRP